MKGVTVYAEWPDHLMLFRQYVSRRAGGRARALLDGVGLNSPSIEACFDVNPRSVEEAVQDGLCKWVGGKGTQPPTWNVLLDAMDYAGIPQQDVQKLRANLSF